MFNLFSFMGGKESATVAQLIYDASISGDITQSGGSPNRILEWRDNQGKGIDVTPPGTGPQYETPSQNGLNGLFVPSGNLRLTRVSSENILKNSPGFTIICAMRAGFVGSQRVMFAISNGLSTASPRAFIAVNGGTFQVGGRRLDSDSLVLAQSGGGTIVNGVNNILSATADHDNNLLSGWINGSSAFTPATFNGIGLSSNTDSLGVGIGGNTEANFGVQYNGRIFEIRLFDKALSTTERQAEESELSIKWNI